MYALDTNILVYAHNTAAPLYEKAKSFVEKIIAEEDENENPVVGIPLQVCSEFCQCLYKAEYRSAPFYSKRGPGYPQV